MKNVITLAALVAMGLGPAIAADEDGDAPEELKREQDLSEKEGQPAPALQATGWMNTPDGEALDLASFAGKVVVIDFWGTW